MAFSLDYENRLLNLTFDEVVNPNTIIHSGITIQNVQNSSVLGEDQVFQFHTFVEGGVPTGNTTGVSTLSLILDINLG